MYNLLEMINIPPYSFDKFINLEGANLMNKKLKFWLGALTFTIEWQKSSGRCDCIYKKPFEEQVNKLKKLESHS